MTVSDFKTEFADCNVFGLISIFNNESSLPEAKEAAGRMLQVEDQNTPDFKGIDLVVLHEYVRKLDEAEAVAKYGIEAAKKAAADAEIEAAKKAAAEKKPEEPTE
jgi:hypothetical protein